MILLKANTDTGNPSQLVEGGAGAAIFKQGREEEEEEEGIYTLPAPTYENLPLRGPPLPIACSENYTKKGSNKATLHPGVKLHITGECILLSYIIP
jgi:hypothetical protein